MGLAPLAVPERVLTIGAHPDDAEFGAGAALARWAASGTVITMVVVTDGSKGAWDPDTDQSELVRTRKEEQARAAEVLGVENVIHLGLIDGELEYSMGLRKDLALHIRATEPDVVLTHDPWRRYQLHPDHRVTGFATVDAVVAAREPLMYRDLGTRAHRPNSILLWSADEPDHAEPVEAEWFDRKVDALLCHASQAITTMSSAQAGFAERMAFIDRIATQHVKSGEILGVGPSETFKMIVP